MQQQESTCLYFPKHGIIYINNPKAGCTTIKRSLMSDFESPSQLFHKRCHAEHDVCNFSPEILSKAPVIFIGRNPFARFRSCYWNKVFVTKLEKQERKSKAPAPMRRDLRRKMRKYFDITGPMSPTMDMFIEFVRWEMSTLGASEVNPHYRPQTQILAMSRWKPDVIGKLEAIDVLWEQLQDQFKFRAPIKQRFNASSPLAELTPDQEKAIAELYADDFDLLNY